MLPAGLTPRRRECRLETSSAGEKQGKGVREGLGRGKVRLGEDRIKLGLIWFRLG